MATFESVGLTGLATAAAQRQAALTAEIASISTYIGRLRSLYSGTQTLAELESAQESAMRDFANWEARANAPGLSPSQRAALLESTDYVRSRNLADISTQRLNSAYRALDVSAYDLQSPNCVVGCVYDTQGNRIGNFLQDPTILDQIRQQNIVYVTDLAEKSALKHALRQSPQGAMPQIRHLTPHPDGGVVTAAARAVRGENRVSSSVTILGRRRIATHQVEVHVDPAHGPHIHIDRGTRTEQYIRLDDPNWLNLLPRALRKNSTVMDAIYEAAFYNISPFR